MFVMLEGNSILVYNTDSKLAYKSFDVLDYVKFSQDILVVVTEDSIDFVIERVNERKRHVAVSRDTKFKEVVIQDNYLFIRRGGIFDSVDIYDGKLELVLRLNATIDGTWKYINTFFGVPIKFMSPLFLNKETAYLSHKKRNYALHLATGKLVPAKIKDVEQIRLKNVLEKLKIK